MKTSIKFQIIVDSISSIQMSMTTKCIASHHVFESIMAYSVAIWLKDHYLNQMEYFDFEWRVIMD